METDIHLAVERRVNGQWQRVLPPPEVYDPWLKEQAEKDTSSMNSYYKQRVKVSWYDDRNYDCFAMLANVRNGQGFAGCDTGDGFIPISEPRGLPDDLSAEVRALDYETGSRDEDSNDVSLGDHSQSWLTVAELNAYFAQAPDRSTKQRGWVDAWNFELWRKEGKPKQWSGSIAGSRIEHCSNQRLAHLIDSGEIQWEGEPPAEGSWDHRAYTTGLQRTMKTWPLPEGSVGADMAARGTEYYTLVEWPETYADAAGRFYSEILPALNRVGPPEDTRIVFGFDS